MRPEPDREPSVDLGAVPGLEARSEWHEVLGSTNDRARELGKDGAEHGYVVGAEVQTAGRGRKGATWCSERGNGLTFSVVIRPTWPRERWGWLSLGAGLAVTRGLEGLGFAPEIKWPNDVLLGGRKVCGILVEAVGEVAVVGIGINVNERRFPTGLEATSLRQVQGSRVSRESVLGETWLQLLTVLDGGPTVIEPEVWRRLAWRTRMVQTTAGVRGRIDSLGENGELVVASEGGRHVIRDADGLRPVEECG